MQIGWGVDNENGASYWIGMSIVIIRLSSIHSQAATREFMFLLHRLELIFYHSVIILFLFCLLGLQVGHVSTGSRVLFFRNLILFSSLLTHPSMLSDTGV